MMKNGQTNGAVGGGNGNGTGFVAGDAGSGFGYGLEEPVQLKGFAVTYDRKFNLGNFEALNPAITIWVKTQVAEGETFDLHHARERVRRMARENVRAQLLRLQGSEEVVFLGLQPPLNGEPDPIFVRTVSVSLEQRANLGNYQSVVPAFTDWADLRHAAHSSGELHIALSRMWQSLWVNVADEIARAQGKGETGGYFGLPVVEVEDLTGDPPAATYGRAAAPGNGHATNGRPAPPANGRPPMSR